MQVICHNQSPYILNISTAKIHSKQIKHNFGLEPYLVKVSNFKYRNSITKLRTSSHDLHVEKGRHATIPLEERQCKMCCVLEDEAHFLLSCRLFTAERLKLYSSLGLQNIYHKYTTNDLLSYILNTNEQRHLELIGQFIYLCFQKRIEYYDMTT